MIPVVRLAPGNQWDQNLLDRLFANTLYPTGLEFERLDAYPPHADGIILIVPGRYWHRHTGEIAEALSRYRWVLGFRCSDEEDLFHVAAVEHPNSRWWVQTPRTDRNYGTARFLPLGFPPHFNSMPLPYRKELDVFLAGQNTHVRRAAAFGVLRESVTRYVQETEGFTRGCPPEAYLRLMAAAKVAPAPAGAHSPDSFRLYEALESHCIPIADDLSPVYDSRGYWRMLFPDPPFPMLTDYRDLPGWVDDQLAAWPANANRVAAWWMRYKRTLARWLREDLKELGAIA